MPIGSWRRLIAERPLPPCPRLCPINMPFHRQADRHYRLRGQQQFTVYFVGSTWGELAAQERIDLAPLRIEKALPRPSRCNPAGSNLVGRDASVRRTFTRWYGEPQELK